MAFLDFEYQMRTNPVFRDKIINAVKDIQRTYSEMNRSAAHREAYKQAIEHYLEVSKFNLSPLLGFYYPKYPGYEPYSLRDFPFAHCYYQLNLGENSYVCLRGSRQIGKCLCSNNLCKIRNKKTGDIVIIEAGDLFDKLKNDPRKIIKSTKK